MLLMVWRFAVHVTAREHKQLHRAQREPQTAAATAAAAAAATSAVLVSSRDQLFSSLNR